MDIMELGAIGELVGGVAVIATLIYLAVQVRQNTQSTRTSTVRASNARAADFSMFLAGNSECLHAFRVGLENPDGLDDEDERLRFGLVLNGMLRQLDDAFFQYRTGALSPDDWEGFLFTLRQFVPAVGFQMFWSARGGTFTTAFANMIEDEMGKVPATQQATSDLFLDHKGRGGSDR